jgi:hypothetical protein
MPMYGGTPSPRRYGGAGNSSNKPLVQIVYESLVAQMGSAYDQTWPPKTPFGMHMYAAARTIAIDGYGTNQRLANNFQPSKAQIKTGMLQRWERIFDAPPLPNDTEKQRQTRVGSRWLRFSQPATDQPMIDALQALLGSVYVGIVKQTLANELAIINGIGNITSSGTAPPILTCEGIPGPVEADQIYVACTTGGPRGTALFKWSIDDGRTFVQTGQTTAANFDLVNNSFPLDLRLHFPLGTYTNDNVWRFLTAPGIPWSSTIQHVDVQVTQTGSGYHNDDGSPNALFYSTVAGIFPLLDELLPAYTTFDWFIASSHGGSLGFFLDEHNLDLLAFSP